MRDFRFLPEFRFLYCHFCASHKSRKKVLIFRGGDVVKVGYEISE